MNFGARILTINREEEIKKESDTYLNSISLEDYIVAKKTGHKLAGKNNYDLLFHLLRDRLSRSFQRREIVNKGDMLSQLASRRRVHLETLRVSKEKEDFEKLRIEKFNSFNGPIIKKDNHWFNCKVIKVKEIYPADIYGDWDEWERLNLSKGRKAQEITLESGEVLLASFSSKSKGIRAFDIINFKVENNNIYIVNNSFTGDFRGVISRAINVSVITGSDIALEMFTSVAAACEYIQPSLSYSSICKKTKDLTSQVEIDKAFYGFDFHSRNISVIYRHGVNR